MKRFFILLMAMVGLSTTINAQVAIDETNFPDPEFRAYLLSQSYGQDGIITDEEMAQIDYLEIKETSITDLTGIELFTSLSGLYCYRNTELTSLDLSGCNALRNINCYENEQLISFSVSDMPALSGLNVENNPMLSEVHVSNLPVLPYFNVLDNPKLKEVQFSGCPSIGSFNCYSNHELAKLSFADCPELESFNCYDNALTSLVVPGCPSLKEIVMYGNQCNDQAMFELVTSLPDRNGQQMPGRILAINPTLSSEGNVCSTTTVNVARGINWNVYVRTDNTWTLYEGSEPTVTAVDEIVVAQPGTGTRYNLMGQPVGNDYKGIVIENGQKVIVR